MMNSSWSGKLTGNRKKSSATLRWLERNWDSWVCLIGIFVLALFLRTYFAYDLATQFGTPYLLGGGADSHYNARIINYIAENNHHLFVDPMRAYPLVGHENVRPPLYQWSVVLGGHLLAPLVGNPDKGIQLAFILSSGFWGAMTTVPVYLIGKKTFGKKAGLAGAFLLAISVAHLERGVITNTNHDAFSLFLIVTAFYFFMRFLEEIPGDKRWVSAWNDLDEIKKGLLEFFGNNKRGLLYAAMTGVALGAVALTWKGYAYAIVIILVYFLIQLVIDKFRERDSLAITAGIFVTMMIAFILAFPWYAQHRPRIITEWLQWPLENWFQVPFVLFLGTFGIGVYFTVTRDFPWILTFSILAVVGLIFFAIAPDVVQTAAGQYFIENKLYSTIAEAQAPGFSRLLMAGGMVTFFLSWVGIAFAIWHLRREWSRSFVFILIWTAFALYMTTTATRFIFNSAPAYALTAGWVVALLFDKTKFEEITRYFRTHRGSYISSLRESVEIKHILVTLFVVFLLLTPNSLYVLDAGIPFEEKDKYNKQIHEGLPEFMRPSDYDPENGSHYLGGFGYSVDKPTDYWPAAWEDIREQASDTPPEERSAFLSWWDYGFEAMNQGEHPTVSDNFQHAHRFSGNFLMAQNESEMLALLVGRQLQLPYNEEGAFEGRVEQILIEHIGEEKTQKLEDIYNDPASYRNEVLNNPNRYHPRADDIHTRNVMWAMVMGTLSYEDKETLSSLYRDISFNSGYERLKNRIGKFAVDSRLFPSSAQDTGIFHAPAFLSGHRVTEQGRSRAPVDFYTLEFIDQQGRSYEDQDEVPEGAEIVDQRINFKDMFYNSTLYRIFAGYGLQEVGEDEGIPGIDNEQQARQPGAQPEQPKPGWNLTYFKEIHRTAWFNPYPQDEVRNHSEAWEAIPYDEAIEYREDDNVTVDLSARSYMRQGVVFLEYNDGAILQGQVETEDGEPIPNAKINVLDTSSQRSTLHNTTRTDEEGRYRAILPEGNVTVAVSNGGKEEGSTQLEQITLDSQQFEISSDQAMRRKVDKTGDGKWDYLLDEDFEIATGEIKGKVFLDKENNDEYNPENDTLVSQEASVNLTNQQSDVAYSADVEQNVTGDESNYAIDNVIPGNYTLNSSIEGTSPQEGVTVEPDQETSKDLAVSTGNVSGSVNFEGDNIGGVTLSLSGAGVTREMKIDEPGPYGFDSLPPGEYNLEIEDEGYTLKDGPQEIQITPDENLTRTINVVKAHRLEGVMRKDGESLSDQKLSISSEDYDRVIQTDKDGEFSVKLPRGDYQIYGVNRKEDEVFAYLDRVVVEDHTQIEGRFEEAYKLTGIAEYENEPVEQAEIFIKDGSSREYHLTSNQEGRFKAYLPESHYTVYGWRQQDPENPQGIEDLYFWKDTRLSSDKKITIEGSPGEIIRGTVFREDISTIEEDGSEPVGEGISADIKVNVEGKTLRTKTSIDGDYQLILPKVESELTFDKEGYYSKSISLTPSGIRDYREIYLKAKNVTVEGQLEFERDDELDIVFRPVGDGAVRREITVSGGEYTTDLQPGKYEIISDYPIMGGDAKYEISDSLTFVPGQESIEKNLTSVYKVRLTGNLSYEGEAINAEIDFQGPENKNVSVESPYEVYLKPGNYSARALHPQERLSNQIKISVDDIPTKKDIELLEANDMNVDIREGPTGEEVPITIEHKDSGYLIKKTVTLDEVDTDLNLNLTEGDYEIRVDYLTQEEISGEMRDVRYHIEEEFDMTPPPSRFDLNRRILNATLTGHFSLDREPLQDIDLMIRTENGEEKTVTTDENGEYTLEELIHGQHTVYISHEIDGKVYSHFESFEMPAENKNMDIELEKAVVFSGEVRPENSNMGTESYSMSLKKGEAEWQFETEEDGSFEIVLPKNEYYVEIETSEQGEYGETIYNYSAELEINHDVYHDIKLTKVNRFDMDVQMDSRSVTQGESIEYTATIENRGNSPDAYEISVAQTDWDVTIDKEKTREISTGETVEVKMDIIVPENAEVGETVTLVAESVKGEGIVKREDVPLEVEQVFGVEISSKTKDGRYGNAELTYSLDINNTGNGPDNFRLEVLNREDIRNYGWEVNVPEQTGEVEANRTKSIEIKLKRNSTNPRNNIEIKLRAVPKGDGSVSSREVVSTSVPQLVAYENSVKFEGNEFVLEKEPFSLSRMQWAGIIILVAIGVLFVLRKKRWI